MDDFLMFVFIAIAKLRWAWVVLAVIGLALDWCMTRNQIS